MVTFELSYEEYCIRYSSIAHTRTMLREQFMRDFVSPGNFSVASQEFDVDEIAQELGGYADLLILGGVRNVTVSYLNHRREIDNLVFDTIYFSRYDIKIYVLDLDTGKTHGTLYRSCASTNEASDALSRCGVIGVVFPNGQKPTKIVLVVFFLQKIDNLNYIHIIPLG